MLAADLGTPASSGSGRRVGALVRSHRRSSRKALGLAAALAEAGFGEVLFVADETRGPVDSGAFEKLPHTLDSLAALGLHVGDPRKALWFCGDHAFYGSVLGRRTSDFWLMVEYDVGLRDPASDWWLRLRLALEDPRLADLDMTGPYLGPYARDHFPHGYTEPWKALFAITGLSSRAVETLFEARLKEARDGAADPRGTHCEIFVPSELRRLGGFRCLDLNDVVPGTAARPAFSTLTICPLGHEDLVPGTCGLLHRVVDMDEYLDKAPAVLGRASHVGELRRQLGILQARGLPAGVADEAAMRAEAEARRIQRRRAVAVRRTTPP